MIINPTQMISAALVALVPTLGSAQEAPSLVVSGDGHAYNVTCNENGFVLTSLYPVFRFIENGASSSIEDGIETIYLGKSCDAFTETFGTGVWGRANGGFIATFDRFSIGFPRQAPYCPNDDAAGFDLAKDCPL